MIRPGDPDRLGATPDADGCNFALYSDAAGAVELCLFAADGSETLRDYLPECSDGVWHGYLPGVSAGQAYGYRVHGPYAPAEGLRFNPNKLLLDPYARALAGELVWHDALLGGDPDVDDPALAYDTRDSAPYVPRSLVVDPAAAPAAPRRRLPWSELIVYEANVRGLTMRHPDVGEAERGRFAGLANGAIVRHLQRLGVTAVELLPVQAFVDERFLVQRGLRNLWGYNTLNFFSPMPRYAANDAIAECRAMIDTLHDAGIEVLLDVVFNHTAEGDHRGPTLSFRGIDNAAYYRLTPDDASHYINDTGTGNTMNVDHPAVRRLIVDSLRYWAKDMGVDGFRFDLATVLGRGTDGFRRDHTLFAAIDAEPALAGVKLIAEPWDVGPGGYQLGNFPERWGEWNDNYRDTVRRYWRGDPGLAAPLAQRLHGSADLFADAGKPPQASVNFVTSHDGFTLNDLVSYRERHNQANGEDNRDGHAENYSDNHGVEGPSDDPNVTAIRRRQRLNMLATLLLSHGTPMLLAGDEFGNTQHGNNNAYAQDNETGWVDWHGAADDPAFVDAVAALIRLRRDSGLFRSKRFADGGDGEA
ncbi:MAG: glycogen debranching protein GlgX, partial [Pseudomonadota bacterium]